MATKATIRSRVLSLLANHSQITSADVNTLIETVHEEILNDYGWSMRRADLLVNTVPTVSSGTVSASGTTVTGSGTNFTSDMVGRFIRIGSSTFFFRIIAVASATSLTIEAPVPEAVAAGTSYVIFKHRYTLPADFGGRITSAVSDQRLREVSRQDLDRYDPYRIGTATRPEYYSVSGLDPSITTSQRFQIELYPVPSSAQTIRIEYLRENALANDTDEPLYPSDVLVWKAAEAGAFFLYARNGDQAWVALADRYHQRYLEAFELAKLDDLSKNSPARHVRDALVDSEPGDDFLINRDWGIRLL